jgi:hypothetical protein
MNGRRTKVLNEKIGKTLFISTVARRTKPYLPDGSRMNTSLDIAIFNNRNGFSLPLVRVLISEDLPQYVMPEIHEIVSEMAQEFKSEEFNDILAYFYAEGFIIQYSSERDLWHGLKKLNLIYVTDMEEHLADRITKATTQRMSKQMKQSKK